MLALFIPHPKPKSFLVLILIPLEYFLKAFSNLLTQIFFISQPPSHQDRFNGDFTAEYIISSLKNQFKLCDARNIDSWVNPPLLCEHYLWMVPGRISDVGAPISKLLVSLYTSIFAIGQSDWESHRETQNFDKIILYSESQWRNYYTYRDLCSALVRQVVSYNKFSVYRNFTLLIV